jgi:hypothetical protein
VKPGIPDKYVVVGFIDKGRNECGDPEGKGRNGGREREGVRATLL